MAKKGAKKKSAKKSPAKLSAKAKGKVWGGLRLAGRSLRACIAVLKNRKATKKDKAKAKKRLESAKEAIHNFQGLLGLKKTKFFGPAK